MNGVLFLNSLCLMLSDPSTKIFIQSQAEHYRVAGKCPAFGQFNTDTKVDRLSLRGNNICLDDICST